MLLVGAAVAVAAWMLGAQQYALVAGWIAGGLSYLAWVWFRISKMDASETKSHSTREDPSRTAADLVLVLACLASLGIVVLVLTRAASASGFEKLVLASVALISVALSWALIHTLYTLRYASVYYRSGGKGIDFNQESNPDYRDFAYVSFMLGMTFQIADTALSSREIRMVVLRHGLLSYVFGVVILASVVNLIAGLGA
ncbi:MAG: DUF1345 domain-containing protein [Microbacteriaceae bacterium]|nr:DUF1345 domain-containing protein [Cryobacterium sp.]MBX3103431.1 DUF1345 domain-containing protein [Cryobacterium sp.]MCC6376569.1 DUF1345 domain-containing protein [Microbacteriaceae bacterium]